MDYLCGFGCKKDIQKAKEFFKKAIDKGNDEIALFNYADILMKERNNTSDALKKNELYKASEDVVFKYIPDICDRVTFSKEPITIDVKPITYEELYDNEETTLEA